MVRFLLPALLILLAGCSPSGTIAATQTAIGHGVSAAQYAMADAVTAPTLALQETVQEAAPTPPPVLATGVASAAAPIIIRWEVTSEQVYSKRYRQPVWPGGASGVTWGVGYDGGHQTQIAISRDWSSHPHVATLKQASGVIGLPAKQLASSMRDVLTPFGYAAQVLERSTLPAYETAARRALGPGFDRLPVNAAASLVDLGYNRGWAMSGERNREKRAIRDDCVPAGDVRCIAEQLRAMKRLWPDVKGLRDRRDYEAKVATS